MALTAVQEQARPEAQEAFSFDDVYRRHAALVTRWCGRLLGPGADVEDLVQEVFVVVNRQLPAFRGDARLSTWLFRITDRLAANQRRRRAVRRLLDRLTPQLERSARSGEPTPLEQMERRERHLQFYDVLDRLRERQRKVLILFEIEGLSTDQIAELLDMTAGNVRVVLHRARTAFLEEMTRLERQEAR